MSDSESVISSSQNHEDDRSTDYTNETFDEENTCTIRGKWVYDGSETIDEMIACLQREIEALTELKEAGWYLADRVDDDYAILRREPCETQEEQEQQEDASV